MDVEAGMSLLAFWVKRAAATDSHLSPSVCFLLPAYFLIDVSSFPKEFALLQGVILAVVHGNLDHWQSEPLTSLIPGCAFRYLPIMVDIICQVRTGREGISYKL